MSNGTRIDPEEREPRAIKIRQPKHTGRKIALAVLSVILLIAICGGIFVFIEYGPEFGSIAKAETESESSESEPSYDSSSVSESSEPDIPEEPVSSSSAPESSSLPESSSEPEIPEVTEPIVEEDPIPRDEWYMLLVNRENPLPEGFAVETAAIDNEGHAVDARIYDDLAAMIAAGENEGLDFIFYTAYRSVNRQRELYESGATDAAPGTSEHNSGLAVDIGCAKGEFEGSAEEKWLLSHAHEYGFILRYPADKVDITGFEHEPWHFRYVGKEQAKLIYESGLCLEEYLAE
ncbi:MAG: M15 family metallopeptidase [Oscillospiraceae bacterium]|nr:M15 family metallopeptidase [Oscillospiraceae bacterium]